MREPGGSSGRWPWFVVGLNVVAFALLFTGMFRTLQRGLLAGAVLCAIVVAIVIGYVRADQAARRLSRGRGSNDGEGGEVTPPPLG